MESTMEGSPSFHDVIRDYKRGIFALAFDLTGNHHDAEDLTQEVFIKAHKGLASFRGESGLYAWLRRIAVNTHLNRRRKKSVSLLRLFGDVDESASWSGSEPSPFDGAAAQNTRGHIDRALDGLSPRERTAFVMRHYHEQSTREVADAMGVAQGTVKSLLFRATTKLRDSLDYLRHES